MGSHRLVLGCAVLVLVGSVPSRAQEVPAKADTPPITSLPAIPPTVHDALQSRAFDAALEAIDAELARGEAPVVAEGRSDAAYLLYLKGRALTELRRFDDAINTYRQIEEQHTESPWVSRARFGRADVLVRGRNYLAASEIYRAEAERLVSRGRKDEVAAIYLEFADRYFTGITGEDPTQVAEPDFEQAATYFQEALKLGPTSERRESIEFHIARCHEELRQWGDAVAAYQRYLQNFEGDDHEVRPRIPVVTIAEARYRLGRSQLNNSQPAEARRSWQSFLTGETPEGLDEVESQIVRNFRARAAYEYSHTYGLPQPGSTGDLELAVAAARQFLAQFPDHELAPLAELEIAQGYLHHGRFAQAVDQLNSLIAGERDSAAEQTAVARRLLGVAYLSQQEFSKAIQAWQAFLEHHPSDPHWNDAQQQIIDAEYARAAKAKQDRQYDEARDLWEVFLKRHPLDLRVAGILYQFGDMHSAAARDAYRERLKAALDQGQSPQIVKRTDAELREFEQAIGDWRRLVSKYPDSPESSRAAYMIGVTLEEPLGRLHDAIAAYRQVRGQYQGKAEQRISRITEASFEIATERKFRSDEQPRIKLSSRNVESVVVKMYRIDMVDYFRKMHLASGVETLDIALIDPDQQFDHSVPGYEMYRVIESDIEIPLTDPGVVAVTVSSEDKEATTMVIVSDIDLIVKSSRNELFVFAENMRTGRPLEGATLLISDGSNVFAEEQTGRDGILQKTYERLQEIHDLRVFAVSEGHTASTITSLDGLDFAVGLTPRGYLYTDRPAYRAGQLVNIKGIVRWVDEDRLTFKPGEKFRLDVYDARGRLIHTKDVALNSFGTLNDNLLLPETTAQGTCRVHLHQPSGTQSYESTFVVTEYRLEPVRLNVDTNKRVYYRGEEVEATVSLGYYHGTPLAGEEVQYVFGPDGKLETARTDDKGQVTLKLSTVEFSESQPLTLRAMYPLRGLQASSSVFLATRGFEIAVETQRDVFVSGESFETTVTVTDAAGQPVAVDLKLEVFEAHTMGVSDVTPGLLEGSRPVAVFDVRSDKSGIVRHTLMLADPGRYIVRATGVDRFENDISGETALQVSGDRDAVRLRILADEHRFQVGDEASIAVHWREAPALALVTYDGARVLGHQLVTLQTGMNAVRVPMTSELAPNFTLSVAVMERNRFHAASSELNVTRKLQVTLEPSGAVLKPGSPVDVKVRVTDPQGQGVQAELSLGLVQSNLLAMFPDPQAAIEDYFGNGQRESSVRHTTSCTFHYRPRTSGISRYLLAEVERRETLARELRALAAFSDQASGGEWSRPLSEFSVEEIEDLALAIESGELPSEASDWGASLNGASDVQSLSERLIELDTMLADSRLGWLADPTLNADGETIRQMIEQERFESGRFGAFGSGGTGGRQMGGLARGAVPSLPLLSNAIVDPQVDFLNGLVADASRLSVLQGAFEFDLPADQSLHFRRFDVNGNGFADLYDLATHAPMTITAVTSDGNLLALNGRGEAELRQLVDAGLTLLPQMVTAETAFWDPAVVTDAEGSATVTITLPQRSTSWKLRARGVTDAALAGELSVELVTRKELFGELQLPTAFTTGDTARIPVEVHNSLEGERQITVRLRTTMGEKSTELSRQIQVEGPGISRESFPVNIDDGESVAFELTVASAAGDGGQPDRGAYSDTSRRTVAVRPHALPVFATASGTASQSTIAFVQFEDQVVPQNPALEILVGPSVDRALLDAVLSSGGSFYDRCALPTSPLERAISDVLGGVALLEMVGQSRDASTPQAQALSGRIAAALAQLVSAQRDDGGWSWSGHPGRGEADRFLTSRIAWALASARRSGFAVEATAITSATQFLKTAFSQASQSDREGQTILLHGLAALGEADFSFANRLHRERNSLSASGLIHLALVLSELDRDGMALELLRLVKLDTDRRTAHVSGTQRYRLAAPWMASGVELRSLFLLALEEVEPTDGRARELAEWLMGARVGSRWRTEKANGPAIAALARWFGRTQHSAEKYTLTIYVNDQQVRELTIEPAQDGSVRIPVPSDLLAGDKPEQINLDLEGRGTFSYAIVLSGSVPAEKLKSNAEHWSVARRYEPAPRMFDGQPLPRGFSVVSGSYRAFTNPLTQLPAGDRGQVTLQPRRLHVTGAADEEYDYLILTDPIPAGCTVLEDSIQGQFERYEIEPGRITFYIGDVRWPGDITYTLLGYVPGEYRVSPAVLQSFYDPERIAVSRTDALTVLPPGAQSADEYRLSPDELFHLGRQLLARGDHATAHQRLSDLFANWRLRDDTFKEVVVSLFRTSVAIGDHGEIVRFFEITKEKFPDVEVSFEDILQVAASYRELGEYERCYLVYRMTLQGSFERESQVAGFLEDRGEYLRSVQVLEKLLRDYPAESYIATASYALAQEVYRHAATCADDHKLQEAGLTRVHLITAALSMLDHFVSTWPLDPAADQASFAMANALLDLEKFSEAIGRCEQFAARYPDSRLLDSFWYIMGYGHFELSQHEQALDMCRRVADATFPVPETGGTRPADNKWEAVYIMGQVYHSLNRAAEAIAEYLRVKDRFADAAEAIEFFTRKDIALDEVTTVAPDEGKNVVLKFRNVAEASLKVYRIDLMKFGLMQRNLDRVTAINLAGIKPYHEETIALGDGQDYRDREHQLHLPLDEEGAYLVVCRGGNLYATGLVLVTPLSLEVQEDSTSGRVRVTVKNRSLDRFLDDVHVKVIGSANEDFVSGATDLRGLFVADDVRGTSTIIAMADDDHYAFFRGQTPLQGVDDSREPSSSPAEESRPAPADQSEAGLQQLLRGKLWEQNSLFQEEQRSNYSDLLRNDRRGIKTQEAY